MKLSKGFKIMNIIKIILIVFGILFLSLLIEKFSKKKKTEIELDIDDDFDNGENGDGNGNGNGD